MNARIQTPLLALLAATAVACGSADTGAQDEPHPEAVVVTPANGDSVTTPLTVRLEARNVTIRPAGTVEPNTAHHHLFLNVALVAEGAVIPTGPGITHLGAAQTEYVYDSLPPGEHTIVAVLGDYQHVRIPQGRTDTVRVTVR